MAFSAVILKGCRKFRKRVKHEGVLMSSEQIKLLCYRIEKGMEEEHFRAANEQDDRLKPSGSNSNGLALDYLLE